MPEDAAYQNQDGLLQILVDLANRIDETPFELTLAVGGILVSGRLIGGRRYIDRLREVMLGDDPGEAGKALDEVLFEAIRGLYPEPFDDREDEEGVKDEESEDEQDPVRIIQIHLEDAQFFHPGQPGVPGNRAVVWRGLLSSVDGFFYGRLGTE